MIHSVISDSQDLARGYRIIDGYVFTSIDEPQNVFDAIVIRCPERCDCWTPKKPFSNHTLSEHIQYIREHRLEKAMVIAESLDFLRECPTLKGLWIKPADTAPENFDYRPIHHLSPSYLFCETHYGGRTEPFQTVVDYSGDPSLTELYMLGSGHAHYENLPHLKKLSLRDQKELKRLPPMQAEETLSSLEIFVTKIKTLEGIEKCRRLKTCSLKRNFSLTDISDMADLSSSLEELTIENCPKITDFSFLERLTHMKRLVLMGSNQIPSLSFLNHMPDLRFFKFSFEVTDGDLRPCLSVPVVRCLKNKRYYNLRIPSPDQGGV